MEARKTGLQLWITGSDNSSTVTIHARIKFGEFIVKSTRESLDATPDKLRAELEQLSVDIVHQVKMLTDRALSVEFNDLIKGY
jgi:hypothetical protein